MLFVGCLSSQEVRWLSALYSLIVASSVARFLFFFLTFFLFPPCLVNRKSRWPFLHCSILPNAFEKVGSFRTAKITFFHASIVNSRGVCVCAPKALKLRIVIQACVLSFRNTTQWPSPLFTNQFKGGRTSQGYVFEECARSNQETKEGAGPITRNDNKTGNWIVEKGGKKERRKQFDICKVRQTQTKTTAFAQLVRPAVIVSPHCSN